MIEVRVWGVLVKKRAITTLNSTFRIGFMILMDYVLP